MLNQNNFEIILHFKHKLKPLNGVTFHKSSYYKISNGYIDFLIGQVLG